MDEVELRRWEGLVVPRDPGPPFLLTAETWLTAGGLARARVVPDTGGADLAGVREVECFPPWRADGHGDALRLLLESNGLHGHLGRPGDAPARGAAETELLGRAADSERRATATLHAALAALVAERAACAEACLGAGSADDAAWAIELRPAPTAADLLDPSPPTDDGRLPARGVVPWLLHVAMRSGAVSGGVVARALGLDLLAVRRLADEGRDADEALRAGRVGRADSLVAASERRAAAGEPDAAAVLVRALCGDDARVSVTEMEHHPEGKPWLAAVAFPTPGDAADRPNVPVFGATEREAREEFEARLEARCAQEAQAARHRAGALEREAAAGRCAAARLEAALAEVRERRGRRADVGAPA